MPKYQRIPNVVDAFRYGFDEHDPWFRELVDKGVAILAGKPENRGSFCRVRTLDGERVGFHGQWVVRDEDGEVSFFEDGWFTKLYRPVQGHPYYQRTTEEERSRVAHHGLTGE
jgi:hypothetical protein